MNRAERRRWQRNVLRFARACAGPIETYIVPAQDRAHMTLGGEPTGVALVQAIAIWTQQAMKPGARTLCLACDTAFRPDVLPAAYAVSLPFADREHAIVTGVCASCAEREELQRVMLRRLRSIWPTAYSMDGGHGRSPRMDYSICRRRTK
jgi:hypothetical protein